MIVVVAEWNCDHAENLRMRDREGEVDGLGASPMELVDSIWAR